MSNLDLGIEIVTGKFVTFLVDQTGQKYVLENDGGHGPMATGSDEWCQTVENLGIIMDHKKANEVGMDPRRGYAPPPFPSTRTVYRIVLKPIAEYKNDPIDVKKRREELKRAALSKLTQDERDALGFTSDNF